MPHPSFIKAVMDPVFFEQFMESDRETTGSDTLGDDEMSGPAPQKITKVDGKALNGITLADIVRILPFSWN
jgi:hypothetical protein